MFICIAFKSHMEWNNAQHVSAPTTTILPTTVGASYSLNCFGNMLQTCILRNFWLTQVFIMILCKFSIDHKDWQTITRGDPFF